MTTYTEDKMVETFSKSMMMIVGAVIMLQIIQQLHPQQVEAEEEEVAPERYGAWFGWPAGYIMNFDLFEDTAMPEYVGEAAPGTLESEAGWRIYKYEFDTVDADFEPVRLRYAEGNTNFDKVWDDRLEYEYS